MAFSSFGLEDGSFKDDVENNENCDDNIFCSSDEDFNIFPKETKPPTMMKPKPISKLYPNFDKQVQEQFNESAIFFNNQPQTNNISKEQPSAEIKKCKWTKHKASGKKSRFLVKAKEMKEFFRLTEDSVINDFLKMDSCKRIADKYLIAMVFAYFKRADFTLIDYTRINFFIALYLANDVEEDEEELKYEILPWALGKEWRETYVDFLKQRDLLFRLIDYKAIISRKCCDEIMNIEPNNVLWKRERLQHHAGAIRRYMKDPKENGIPRGPWICLECDTSDSQYDSSSPCLSWIISPDESPMDTSVQ